MRVTYHFPAAMWEHPGFGIQSIRPSSKYSRPIVSSSTQNWKLRINFKEDNFPKPMIVVTDNLLRELEHCGVVFTLPEGFKKTQTHQQTYYYGFVGYSSRDNPNGFPLQLRQALWGLCDAYMRNPQLLDGIGNPEDVVAHLLLQCNTVADEAFENHTHPQRIALMKVKAAVVSAMFVTPEWLDEKSGEEHHYLRQLIERNSWQLPQQKASYA